MGKWHRYQADSSRFTWRQILPQLPAAASGDFDLAVVTATGSITRSPPGYQGVTVLPNDGNSIDMAYGNFEVLVNERGSPRVIGGAGSDTIIASQDNDLIF